MNLISVCIVAARPQQLSDCLIALSRQADAPPFEVVLGVPSASRTWQELASIVPSTTMMVVRGRPGAARNEIVSRAAGDVLLFVDDDVILQPSMLRRLRDLADRLPAVEVFGGPNATPPGSPFFQVVQGAVLASLVGSGPVRRRYGKHPPGPADERFFILCNLAVRRDAMLSFPSDLICAEENAVLLAMRESGFAMHYDPELVVFHSRRPDLGSFARQMYKYGFGRGQLIGGQPRTARVAFLLPVVLLVYLATLPAGMFVTSLWAFPAVAYLAALSANAVKIAITMRRTRAWPLAMVLTASVHLFYGAGVIRGAVSPMGRTRHQRVEPRGGAGDRGETRLADPAG